MNHENDTIQNERNYESMEHKYIQSHKPRNTNYQPVRI